MSRLAAARQISLTQTELESMNQAIQLYDSGKYKSSLKAAEAILAAHPEHPDALAVQALCKSQFPSTQTDSLEIARHAVRNSTRSYLCWHALAICNRKNRHFAEALKAYSHAARIEPRSALMIREVALMSLMLRHHAPVIDLRLQFLRLQPHQRSSWTQLALSHHLAGSLHEAIRVMEEYEAVIKERPSKSFDQSETWLYHATLLIEAERYTEAADLLDLNSQEILDVNAKAELLGRSYLKLGRLADAQQQHRFLLERNPHSLPYVQGYLLAKGVHPRQPVSQEEALPLIEEMEISWPDSLAIRTTALELLSGSEFEKRAEAHFVCSCQKGVPSLFNFFKQYYSDMGKRELIGAMAEKQRLAWQESALAEDDDTTESPSAYVWSLYFLAQHYSHVGDSERAQAYIQSAIAHTPTSPELHMTRARILKRTGALHAAADAAETARLLDGQDRYLNCKSVKYALRINDRDTAEALAGKFTMKSAVSPAADLVDMQAFWFMTEEVSASIRIGDYAMALKRLGQIRATKDQMWYEQIDFHSWSVRKFTLRAYLNAMKWWDSTRSHPAAVKAGLQTVELCCKLYDHPELIQKRLAGAAEAEKQQKAHEEASAPKLSVAQKKRLKAKQKAEATKKAEAEANNEDIEPKYPDPDPTGLKALQGLEPLALAQSECGLLQQYAPDNVNTWTATFEWAVRAEQWLIAVRAAKNVERLDPDTAQLHLIKLRLAKTQPHISSGSKAVKVTFTKALTSLASGPAETMQKEFVEKYSESPEYTLAAAKGLLILAPARNDSSSPRRTEVIELISLLPQQTAAFRARNLARRSQVDGRTNPCKNTSLLVLTAGLDLLRDPAVNASDDVIQGYLAASRAAWPGCDAFKDEGMLAKEAAEFTQARQRWQAVAHDARNGVARQP